MEEKIVNKVIVMDVLCLHLDRSVCPRFRGAGPVTQRWEHLADVFEVPADVKSQCANYSVKLTPSEAMFECLSTTWGSLTIGTLRKYLEEIGRNDVVKVLIKKKSGLPGKSITSCNHLGKAIDVLGVKVKVKNVKQLYRGYLRQETDMCYTFFYIRIFFIRTSRLKKGQNLKTS